MINDNYTGWIKLHRSILEWEWWDDRNARDLFIYCLLKANHEDVKWHGQIIERGTFITSRDELAKKTGLTIQQTRTALEKLISTSEITKQTTNKITIITICNYDKYQELQPIEQPTEQPDNQPTNTQQITNKQPTNNQQITTSKESKKVKNKESSYLSNRGEKPVPIGQPYRDPITGRIRFNTGR